MDNKDLYHYASGVDISQNYQDNEEKRAIGYDGEYAVFCALLDHFLDKNLKVLMNVNVPTGHESKTTEIDCLLICETGLVSFEIKNFKGTIYGSPEEENWTQYFRTAENQVFRNPLKQNEYHVQALQRLYPGVPCYSVVVFTNPDCDVSRVTFQERQGAVSTEFCISERNMLDALQRIFNRPVVLDDKGIDKLFEELCQYAAHYTPVPIKDEKIISFNNLMKEARERMDQAIRDVQAAARKDRELMDQTIQNMQETTRQAVERARRSKIRTSILALIIGVAIISAVGLYAKNRIDWYSGQYQEMYQKFQQVSKDDFDIDLDRFCIENFSFEQSTVFDANEFSFHIGIPNPDIYYTNYGYMEYGQAELLVHLKSGEVLSYHVREYSEDLRYVTEWTAPKKLGEFLIEYDLSEIAYIKISNLVFYEDTEASNRNEGHEIELTVYQG